MRVEVPASFAAYVARAALWQRTHARYGPMGSVYRSGGPQWSEGSRAAVVLGVATLADRIVWPAPWSASARQAFVLGVESGLSWSQALASVMAAYAPGRGSSAALDPAEALRRAREVEAWGTALLERDRDPWGSVRVRLPATDATEFYAEQGHAPDAVSLWQPWGVQTWQLATGNPAGLEPLFLFARRSLGLSEAAARELVRPASRAPLVGPPVAASRAPALARSLSPAAEAIRAAPGVTRGQPTQIVIEEPDRPSAKVIGAVVSGAVGAALGAGAAYALGYRPAIGALVGGGAGLVLPPLLSAIA